MCESTLFIAHEKGIKSDLLALYMNQSTDEQHTFDTAKEFGCLTM